MRSLVQVKKVILSDRHPDGVASVAFKEPEDGDVCQAALEGGLVRGTQAVGPALGRYHRLSVEETSRE